LAEHQIENQQNVTNKGHSLRALDLLNFCNSGIQTGLGPFIAIFYASVRHWNPGQIGAALACQSFAGILIQPAVGHWVDCSHRKRLITGAAAVIVTICAACIALLPSYLAQIAVQLVIGLAVTAFPAAISAFALGLVDPSQQAQRISRNESFAHFGNFCFAIAAAVIGTYMSLGGIFYAAAAFALGMSFSVAFIRKDHVDYLAASASESGGNEQEPNRKGIRELFRDRRILTFTLAIVLFYFANAATLPLVGEILTSGKKGQSSAWQISAAVMVAEGVMIGIAAYAGRFADRWGRKPLFLLAFAALVLRNSLTVVNHSEGYLIGLQAFDGVAAAIYGVLLTLVTADLARGTGRFNFLRGAVQSAMGLGGFLSNMLFGAIAKSFGFNASFWGLAGVAALGGLLYQFCMPETRPSEVEDANSGAQQAPAC
jgi:MFS family permease